VRLKHVGFIGVALIAVLSFIWAGTVTGKDETPADDFYFSDWDPEAGRRAFIKFNCTNCHTVAGDAELPKATKEVLGPVLAQPGAFLSPGELMDAIISPSHTVTGNEEIAPEAFIPQMPDFRASMTVEELMHIVVYLNSFEE